MIPTDIVSFQTDLQKWKTQWKKTPLTFERGRYLPFVTVFW